MSHPSSSQRRNTTPSTTHKLWLKESITMILDKTNKQYYKHRSRRRKRTAMSGSRSKRRSASLGSSSILLVSLLMHLFSCDYPSVESFSVRATTTRGTRRSKFLGRSKDSSLCIYQHHNVATRKYLSAKIDCQNLADKKKRKKSEMKPAKKVQQPQKNKKSVNDLVSNMGLTPVPKLKAKKKRETATTPNHQQSPSLSSQLDYARNGHAVLRKYVNPSKLVPIREELLAYGTKHQLQAWRQKVEVAAGLEASNRCQTLEDCQRELGQIGVASDQLPFLQYFNTWRHIPSVHVMALELAETAAILLDVPSVRLYQDSFFWKRSVDGPTPWHTDARMAPFDTSSLVTLWIPLHNISRHGSALQFVSKSHQDFALPFWHSFPSPSSRGNYNKEETNPWDHLDTRYQHNGIVNYMPLCMGDLTAHSGWTLHCADSQVDGEAENTGGDRLALAISYVDARAPVRKHLLSDSDYGDDEDQWSYADWVKDVPSGQEFEHPLVPIVWPENPL